MSYSKSRFIRLFTGSIDLHALIVLPKYRMNVDVKTNDLGWLDSIHETALIRCTLSNSEE